MSNLNNQFYIVRNKKISSYKLVKNLEGKLEFKLNGTFNRAELLAMSDALIMENDNFEFPNSFELPNSFKGKEFIE